MLVVIPRILTEIARATRSERTHLTYDNNNIEINYDGRCCHEHATGCYEQLASITELSDLGSLAVSVEIRAGPTGEAGARAPASPGGPRIMIDKPESIKIYIRPNATSF